jgi:membrane glycosyltransferase
MVGCGAEAETEGYVQIVGETECRILQRERERERERESGGFEHFSRFLVYGYSFLSVEDAHD